MCWVGEGCKLEDEEGEMFGDIPRGLLATFEMSRAESCLLTTDYLTKQVNQKRATERRITGGIVQREQGAEFA